MEERFGEKNLAQFSWKKETPFSGGRLLDGKGAVHPMFAQLWSIWLAVPRLRGNTVANSNTSLCVWGHVTPETVQSGSSVRRS